MGQRERAGRLIGRLRSRLEGLERRVEVSHDAMTLPDGAHVLYTQPDALRALEAAIRGREDALLGRFLQADTAEGMAGLCRALVGSRSDG